jgi:hexosaminidase
MRGLSTLAQLVEYS